MSHSHGSDVGDYKFVLKFQFPSQIPVALPRSKQLGFNAVFNDRQLSRRNPPMLHQMLLESTGNHHDTISFRVEKTGDSREETMEHRTVIAHTHSSQRFRP